MKSADFPSPATYSSFRQLCTGCQQVWNTFATVPGYVRKLFFGMLRCFFFEDYETGDKQTKVVVTMVCLLYTSRCV